MAHKLVEHIGMARDVADALRLAHQAWKQKRLSDALELALQVEPADVKDTQALEWLGSLFRSSGELGHAHKYYEIAFGLDPERPGIAAKYAQALISLGRFDAARTVFSSVSPQDPNYAQALYGLAYYQRQTEECNVIPAIETALLNCGSSEVAKSVALRFALGKSYEDLSDYSRAFREFEAGCLMQRKKSRYQVEDDVRVMDQIASVFQNGSPQSTTSRRNGPIFVVGMPRSGTTLVERILSSHSMVTSVGESSAFTHALSGAVQEFAPGQRLSRSQAVEQSVALDFAKLGDAYSAAERRRVGAYAYFVDKMPLNFLYIGLILRALPTAKIIVVRRDPIDNCLAMFTTLFAGAYPFSYRFDELATYYASFDRLMRHWQEVDGDALRVVSYESLIGDFESQVKSLVSFLELEWEPACLQFESNAMPTATASAFQVRSPLYASSVGRWRNYEAECAPLVAALTDAGVENTSMFF